MDTERTAAFTAEAAETPARKSCFSRYVVYQLRAWSDSEKACQCDNLHSPQVRDPPPPPPTSVVCYLDPKLSPLKWPLARLTNLPHGGREPVRGSPYITLYCDPSPNIRTAPWYWLLWNYSSFWGVCRLQREASHLCWRLWTFYRWEWCQWLA